MTAAPFVPAARSLKTLREAARSCRGCPLWKGGTQTVFGAGPARARVVMVGEQPGDREDIEGRPWLDAELAAIHPAVVVALGATAAQGLMGAQFRVTQTRGKIYRDTAFASAFVATVHPSSILRGDPGEREATLAAFVADLKVVAELLK